MLGELTNAWRLCWRREKVRYFDIQRRRQRHQVIHVHSTPALFQSVEACCPDGPTRLSHLPGEAFEAESACLAQFLDLGDEVLSDRPEFDPICNHDGIIT